MQCNSEGKCLCREGVTGDKCDRCAENHFDFGPTGCKPCGCTVAGSLDNEPRCEAENGNCICKENVEGIQCNKWVKHVSFDNHMEKIIINIIYNIIIIWNSIIYCVFHFLLTLIVEYVKLWKSLIPCDLIYHWHLEFHR